METLENQIVTSGHARSSQIYGGDYLTELRRVLKQHVKPVTRAYLEWGAGNTTLAILQMRETLPLDDFFSIEDNQDYLDQLVAQFPAWSGFHPVYRDLTGPMANDRDPELNYSTFPLGLGRQFDFIFIDGRRRLECAFVASLLCHPQTIVMMHDYRRARYQAATALYDVIEDGTQFRVMRKRRTLSAANLLAAAKRRLRGA